MLRAEVAQLVELQSYELRVEGSIPSFSIFVKKHVEHNKKNNEYNTEYDAISIRTTISLNPEFGIFFGSRNAIYN